MRARSGLELMLFTPEMRTNGQITKLAASISEETKQIAILHREIRAKERELEKTHEQVDKKEMTTTTWKTFSWTTTTKLTLDASKRGTTCKRLLV